MRTLVTVTVAATMLNLPAFAENEADLQGAGSFVGREVDVSFEASRLRLEAHGYRNVKRVNGDALHLAAFDPQGSEVLLTVSPQSGEIDSTVYVNSMDQ